MPTSTTPSGGPQGEFSTYTPIYSTTLSSAVTTITLSNIPTTYTDLVLVYNGKTVTDNVGYNMTVNGDTGSNYSYTLLRGNGTAASSSRGSTQTVIVPGFYSSNDQNETIITNLLNYSNTSTYKTLLTRGSIPKQSVEASVNMWRSTSPITRIDFFAYSGNLAIGSTITLYGIKAAYTQFIPTKAIGGDVVTSDGTYAYHTFYNSGTFVPAQALTCDYLIVAGGGGSQGTAGGGGGAGGYRSFTSQSLTATPYTVVVGAGGTKGTPTGGTQGGSSSFNGSTSAGGGQGGDHRANNGGAGGSGGGVGGAEGSGSLGGQTAGAGNTPATSPSQGNNGGVVNSNTRGGAGGGGASAVGGSPTNGNGAAGGAGTNWLSLGTYYAGGGGGAATNITDNGTYSGGAGGIGGGGNGATASSDGQPGAYGTGGGAGGGSYIYGSGPRNGAAGGSGIVIVRYAL